MKIGPANRQPPTGFQGRINQNGSKLGPANRQPPTGFPGRRPTKVDREVDQQIGSHRRGHASPQGGGGIKRSAHSAGPRHRDSTRGLARFVCDICSTPSFVTGVKLGMLHASRVCLHFREAVILPALGIARMLPVFETFEVGSCLAERS